MVELGAEWLITPLAYRDQWPGIEFLSQERPGNLGFPAETSVIIFPPGAETHEQSDPHSAHR